MRYPGGKGGAGVYQTIINLMPAHEIYIEPFIGGGNIYERKKPALASIVIDADATVIAHWKKHATASTTVIHGDAVPELAKMKWTGKELIYCDPPYVMASRSGRKIYQHEMTDQQHRDLIALLLTIPAAIVISGYANEIYDTALKNWHRVEFQAMTRGGVRTEVLWMNYTPPAVPSELTYIGDNYRERQRIKRKTQRWAEKLRKLPPAEQAAIMEVLQLLMTSEPTMIEHSHK